MVFKTIFTEPRKRRSRAFTLVEMLVAVGVGGILMAAVASVTYFTFKSFHTLIDYAELEAQSRRTVDRMTQKIRMCNRVTAYNTNSISLNHQSGQTLTFHFDPGTKKLTEQLGNVTPTTLLEDCSYVVFEIYKRNPIASSFNQFPTADVFSETKLVRVRWKCARSTIGSVQNTEELISAKIVLRTR